MGNVLESENGPVAKVFVTDAQQRKAVPIVRALGRRGVQVVAGDSTRWSMAFFSKYCLDWVVYPSPTENPDLFLEWLIDHLRRNHYDALFPIDERTLGPVTCHLDELREYTAVPVVDRLTYMKARDKGQTIRIALEMGSRVLKHILSTISRMSKPWRRHWISQRSSNPARARVHGALPTYNRRVSYTQSIARFTQVIRFL